MEIKKIAAYATQLPQRTQEKNPGVEEDKALSGKEASMEADHVKWSRGYQEMAQVKKVMMERGEFRVERVDHIRNMIENKTYVVDPDKIAKKMLEELW